MAAQELIIVCVDNSASCIKFQSQIDAIQLYCHAKLKSNPKTAVGIVAMATRGFQRFGKLLHPTSDLDDIMDCVQAITQGGDLDFASGITFSEIYLKPDQPNVQKRMLIFAGFPTGIEFGRRAEVCGNNFKRAGIAVDLVNLCPEFQHISIRRALNVIVARANNNQNSHIKHVVAGSSIRDVLSSTPAIITSEEIAAAAADLKKAACLPRKKKVRKSVDMKLFFEELQKGNVRMLMRMAV